MAPPPRDIKQCEKESHGAVHRIPWRQCHGENAISIGISGTNESLYDWVPVNQSNPQDNKFEWFCRRNVDCKS